jgi:8-oxo-dGTP pyrophosphatase MutT (NUDIX family)
VSETAVEHAASVVLGRDGSGGLEVLLLRRTAKASFAANAWVFPGGRLEAADYRADEAAEGADHAAADGLAAACRAAARETAEEAGLLVDPLDFAAVAQWCPPPNSPRRFLTWILFGPAPDQPVTIDGTEIVDHQWLRPADALAARDAGRLELLPPTWITLWELTAHGDVAAAMRALRAATPQYFETHIGRLDTGMVAMWVGDAGYDDGDPLAGGSRHRLWMLEEGWRYERSG